MSQRFYKHLRVFVPALLGLALVPAVVAQSRPQHFILILEDSPVAESYRSAEQARSLAAGNYRQQLQAKHEALKSALASRHIQVSGETSSLLNAVFVVAPKERVDELRALPGVKGVVPGRRYHLNLNRATQLVDGPGAWNVLGGTGNAGAGVKIGIIDTGIDQTHPAFQDSSLAVPAGFPICKTAYPNGPEVSIPNCSAYTNNKVIVARSYTAIDAAGSDPSNPAADSNPDDYTPRDRVGHGTGTASEAAGVSNTGPAGLTFNGMAPKAYLGNYKVFGSPLVNDGAADDAIIMALEDALSDGMDVASLSLGGPAFTGPLDTGAACGQPSSVPCDPLAVAVENAVHAGLVVVIAAGNDGDGASSYFAPTLGSIESPGDAPSAIAVGSTTNSHYIANALQVLGSGVPSNLQLIPGELGDGPPPNGQSGPLLDVTQLGDNGLGCSAFPAASLNRSFALIERGTCNFSVKVTNAQNAGAIGVVLYMADSSPPITPGGLTSTNIPTIMIGNSDGTALKSFIGANSGYAVTIPRTGIEIVKSSSLTNLLSYYSSTGPSTGDNAIKPDLVATGGSENFFSDIYLATQNYDPLGELYSLDRYFAGSGTSFATPLVAGAAALVKQAHPNFSPAQIKSALVNSASQVVTVDEQGGTVGVQQLGGGLLDAGAAVQSTVVANPPSISFGVVSTVPATKSFQITNSGTATANLSLVITPAVAASGASVTIDQKSLTLAPGATATVNATVSGFVPSAGSYSGFVTVQGGPIPIHIPYLFLVASPAVGNMIVLSSPADTLPGQDAGPIVVRLVDNNGAPVVGLNVSFTAQSDASLQDVQGVTDANGIASAEAFLGSTPGTYNFSARFGRLNIPMSATALQQPRITAGSVLNAASFSQPIAPGSYISIFGTNLSTTTAAASTLILPLTIQLVTVSFDVPSAQLSLPGHMVFVSPNQVNVQVPWELQGQSSVQMKVTAGDGAGLAFGNVVTVPLSDYSPALFKVGDQVASEDLKGNVIGPSNPAARGQTIQLYANGLGPVTNQPASGDPAPSSPLASCKSAATVTIGTTQVSPSFCGLAPGFAGLYQLNVAVPSGLTPGSYPVSVSIGGQTSQTANIAVQ
ncbi:MAG TPA: S8 family serine peptidase [Bryobacteraceae bacterium]|nr:S8 family serine peptidase [Bryobacteraceae bacterium]